MAERLQDAEAAKNLAPSGTPMPLGFRLMLRYFVGPMVAGRANWEKAVKGFDVVNAKILAEAAKLSDEEMNTRVLVPSQYGLEESSRYWSAAMVLEHIVIVGSGIKGIVISLSNGTVPDYKVELSRVKPRGKGTPQQAIADFKQFADTAQGEIAGQLGSKDSKAALDHPWFGKFNTRQWHWLLSAHSVIHLQQVRAIVERLKPTSQ